MLRLLKKGFHILNVDQSWVNESDYSRSIWCQSDVPATLPEKAVGTRLALIAALGTDNEIFFALTHANTDSEVMLLYLTYLCRQLD